MNKVASKSNPFNYAKAHLGIDNKQFRDRITELLDRAQRLAQMEADGFRYRRVWVESATVKKHTRAGYYTYRPVKSTKGKNK